MGDLICLITITGTQVKTGVQFTYAAGHQLDIRLNGEIGQPNLPSKSGIREQQLPKAMNISGVFIQVYRARIGNPGGSKRRLSIPCTHPGIPSGYAGIKTFTAGVWHDLSPRPSDIEPNQ
ncbi:hypothetical protein GRF56_12045 [Aeromonas veronii]|uniref:hypothetical protein n=1 Tax=Aeromonas veronii TaxID=654 RepID=UPI00131757C7|nr:hypothetical protein [Aeromonas veronii]QHC08093.1 hypothetical protein GRF56_12045 [Aeromonas veronii]